MACNCSELKKLLLTIINYQRAILAELMTESDYDEEPLDPDIESDELLNSFNEAFDNGDKRPIKRDNILDYR